ncbi:MAG: M20/M25/M40 family metallo-hydrolase [Streptococcaceae bacterium]|jgi:acetylornithine deacetylase|nr:M20/M25/M40 family metallo-hydrolase [Streptococcaceae bacterium]
MYSADVIELTKKLIGIPSASGHEAEILFFLKKYFADAVSPFIKRDGKFVAAKLTGKSSERAFILAGHIDTVVPGDMASWEHSPYEALEKEGKIIGLGASDMLAGVAANIIAASQFKEAELDYDLWVVATANEEIDGQGSADFVQWFKSNTHYKEVNCIIAEPTNLNQIEIGQRGNRFISLSFHGQSAHGSLQENFDKSALSKVTNFLADLDENVAGFSVYRNPILGKPSLVPTGLNAGNPKAPNKTAGRADLTIDLRTTPELEAEFEEVFSNLANKYQFTWKYIASPVMSTLVNPELVFIQKLSEISNIKKLVASPSSNDSGFFEEAGIHTVILGPGDMEQAHQANEYVAIEKIQKFTNILIDFLRKL